MTNEYYTLQSNKIHIRRDCHHKIPNIDAIIFDCDGVLIDVRNSYTRTIIATTNYVSDELFGITLPNPVLSQLIHLFKMSGGFNNEWDITYAILLSLLTSIPYSLQSEFTDQVDQTQSQPPYTRYQYLVSTLSHCFRTERFDVQKAIEKLFTLTQHIDSTGIHSIQVPLITLKDQQIFVTVKKFLDYPGPVGQSLITTIFEELFCGPSLFQTIYKQNPKFSSAPGFITQEEMIVNDEILNNLTESIGTRNFGIATGRPYQLTKYSLGPLLHRFRKSASVFLENVLQAEAEHNDLSLTKPHPFSLLQSAKGFTNLNLALYIGDSAEDIIMVNDARKERDQFLSVGVYSTSDHQSNLITTFKNLKTDIILPSIRELSSVINPCKVKQ